MTAVLPPELLDRITTEVIGKIAQQWMMFTPEYRSDRSVARACREAMIKAYPLICEWQMKRVDFLVEALREIKSDCEAVAKDESISVGERRTWRVIAHKCNNAISRAEAIEREWRKP